MVSSGEKSSGRILVVDDEEPILFAMRDYFSSMGYEVACASEKEEAEAMLSTYPYDLMFADLRLSGLEGHQGLELVSFARANWPSLRIVVLTAYGSPEVEARARELGADSFLHKPQPLSSLAAIAADLMGTGP